MAIAETTSAGVTPCHTETAGTAAGATPRAAAAEDRSAPSSSQTAGPSRAPASAVTVTVPAIVRAPPGGPSAVVDPNNTGNTIRAL
ncbi:MAG: hypothetical protein ACQEXM_18970 [Actinomycetota bacterium]